MAVSVRPQLTDFRYSLPRTKRETAVTSRTTRKTVTFKRPFILNGIDGTHAPGVYEVVTDEESLDSMSIIAYRRVATFIQIQRDGDTQVYPIDPVELDAALIQDGGVTIGAEAVRRETGKE
jgi:hypothetical protein